MRSGSQHEMRIFQSCLLLSIYSSKSFRREPWFTYNPFHPCRTGNTSNKMMLPHFDFFVLGEKHSKEICVPCLFHIPASLALFPKQDLLIKFFFYKQRVPIKGDLNSWSWTFICVLVVLVHYKQSLHHLHIASLTLSNFNKIPILRMSL